VHRIVLRNGASVEATPDHLVFASEKYGASGRWLRVDELRAGQRLRFSTRTTVSKS